MNTTEQLQLMECDACERVKPAAEMVEDGQCQDCRHADPSHREEHWDNSEGFWEGIEAGHAGLLTTANDYPEGSHEREMWNRGHAEAREVCCCGEIMGEGGSLCRHGGCRPMKEHGVISVSPTPT